MRLRLGVCVLTAAVILAASACSDDTQADDASGSTPASSSSHPSTDSTSSTTIDVSRDRDAVEAAYQKAYAVYAAATEVPDPSAPGLAETRVGAALDQATADLAAWQVKGQALRVPQPSQSRSVVESVDFPTDQPDHAQLAVCTVDDSFIIDIATGEVVAAPTGGAATSERTIVMQLVDGTWKVAELRTDRAWEGVAGCAA